MKIPANPPHINEILGNPSSNIEGVNRIMNILAKGVGPAPHGKYRHWDTLRHITPPEGLTVEEW